jgi:hypothetical protein
MVFVSQVTIFKIGRNKMNLFAMDIYVVLARKLLWQMRRIYF